MDVPPYRHYDCMLFRGDSLGGRGAWIFILCTLMSWITPLTSTIFSKRSVHITDHFLYINGDGVRHVRSHTWWFWVCMSLSGRPSTMTWYIWTLTSHTSGLRPAWSRIFTLLYVTWHGGHPVLETWYLFWFIFYLSRFIFFLLLLFFFIKWSFINLVFTK